MALPIIRATGNLTADPEMRYTNNGTAVSNMTIACNSRRKNESGEWVDGETTFLRVNAWKGLAENVAQQFSKGQKISVMGRLKQRNWEDKQGNKRTSFEVEADELASPVSRFNDSGGSQSAPQQSTGGFGGGNDEPPF